MIDLRDPTLWDAPILENGVGAYCFGAAKTINGLCSLVTISRSYQQEPWYWYTVGAPIPILIIGAYLYMYCKAVHL